MPSFSCWEHAPFSLSFPDIKPFACLGHWGIVAGSAAAVAHGGIRNEMQDVKGAQHHKFVVTQHHFVVLTLHVATLLIYHCGRLCPRCCLLTALPGPRPLRRPLSVQGGFSSIHADSKAAQHPDHLQKYQFNYFVKYRFLQLMFFSSTFSKTAMVKASDLGEARDRV